MPERKTIAPVALLMFLVPAFLVASCLAGCGRESDDVGVDETGGRPEKVTAYDAVQYTRPAADKWQGKNWTMQVRDGDPDGIDRDGKGRIWEVYYFSPTPEQDSQLLVIYNRGRVWPSVPTRNKGGDEGREAYRKDKPPEFRVDSSEAYNVGLRNGGSEFMEARADTQVHCVLRCKADYDSVGEEMPAPKYKWVWDVYYREPVAGSEILHVYVDGMNGDFIAKEVKKPPG